MADIQTIMQDIRLSVEELKNRKDLNLLEGSVLVPEIEKHIDEPIRLLEIFRASTGGGLEGALDESIWAHDTRLRSGDQKSLFAIFRELENEIDNG
jgi:hypothetical protein